MKKLIYVIASCLILLGGVLTSCSMVPDPEEVMQKINTGATLDDADYAVMTVYLEDFCDAGEKSPNTAEAGAEVAAEYPYFMAFAIALENAPSDVQDADVRAVLNRTTRLLSR